MSGLYIHIPFCEQRCFYCAFTIAVSPSSVFEPYIGRLLREMRLANAVGIRWETIYCGGGTPSLIDTELLGSVLKPFSRDAVEITVEANPGTLSESKVRRYRDFGITRISLGAQSLEDADLRRAGRLHNAQAVYEDFGLLRRCGFDNINLDLIANLPDQQMETWERNLDRVLDLRPEHISVYMLDHEDRSAWGRAQSPPDEAISADFYALAEARLDASGYRHYEISNWALPGWECRHNLAYWSGVPYRGFGVGAHSFDGMTRFWNTPSLSEYAERLDAGQLPLLGEEVLTPGMKVEEAFMLGLRQETGVDILEVAKRFGLEFSQAWFARVTDLQAEGWILFDGTRLQLTGKGRLCANSVIEELLWPTPTSIFEAIP